MDTPNNALCTACTAVYQPEDVFCNGCGFPIKGTERDQELHLANRQVKEIDLVELNEKVESARKSLFWIAGLTAVFSLIGYATAGDAQDASAIVITNAILVAAFVGLGFWASTKPVAALISGLSLYLIIHLLNAIVEPMSILSGIIAKVLIIGYLIKGIRSVLEADKIKKELNIN
ncbi:hypothetical protein PBAL39_06181 [Pedobacter sp. BAL39]|uniref:hypothetical protein n=1 Tax=Pedobacter sp. BAL39 TaxID=391596 RepID=UPI0001559754|nr:hypothetical protein [Pedobacter sp. BAL39]EDM35744.1 hypothetical protein PBAL39_06181 [Pedobacter sp. BAL39]